MEYLIICTVAFLGSLLTLFSGFGLGTILVPVFGLFFPIEIAISLTAIVHFLNNLFKLSLLGSFADKSTLIRFGIPSFLAAFLGAYVLKSLAGMEPVYQYFFNDKLVEVVPVKLIIAILLIIFSLFELIPALTKLNFDKKYLIPGGLLSGFFGGLSGHQGALRTAFLIRAGLTKEAFIATGVVIACMTDISRLTVYLNQMVGYQQYFNLYLMIAATLSAFGGAWLGKRLMKSTTLLSIQFLVAILMIIFAILLGAGLI